MKYSLVEIFESLQGEGRNTGKQCIFVRFAGCNLKCPWCDTSVAPRLSLSLDELLAEISTSRSKNIILTGGEPTIVSGMAELVAALKNSGYWIAVETNGTRGVDDAPWLEFVDYIATSPKIEEGVEAIRLSAADEVRVVASQPQVGTVPFCNALREKVRANDYYISPCERDGVIDWATAKDTLAKLPDWSLSVQLHKVLGFR